MTHILVNIAVIAASVILMGVLISRRSWFVRHVRHWVVAWIAALTATVFVMLTAIAGLLLEPFPWALELGPALLAIGSTALIVFVTLQRPETVVPKHHSILVVAAHPDDLELAAGGSLARFADRGHDVRAIVMSDGAVGGDAHTRPGEAEQAAAFLGLRDLTLHKYTDTRLGLEMEHMIGAIESAIADFRPDIILTHSANDQHQDHHSVHLAVLRAGRRIPTILCFESPSVTPEFEPRFFVDVADYLDAKVGGIQWHADQLGKPYMGSDRVIGQAAHRGSQAKIQYAEGFEVVRALSSAVGAL